MADEIEVRSLIDLLREHEEGMEILYRAYARLFPGSAEAFEAIAGEEFRHAAAVREFGMALAGGGGLDVDAHRIKIAPLKISRQCLQDQIAIARIGQLTLPAALNIALTFERSLVEKRFFEVFQSDAPRFRRLLEVLAEGTRGHLARIEALQKAVRHVPAVTR